jgi:hypothetical protein
LPGFGFWCAPRLHFVADDATVVVIGSEKLEEQTMRIDDARAAVRSLEERMDHRFDQIDSRFVLIDQRFLGIDSRLDKMTHLLVALLVAVIGGMGGVIAAILQGP